MTCGKQSSRSPTGGRPPVWPSSSSADGTLDGFIGQGVAVDSNTPITVDTVFRIGWITKTPKAVAVMQLWEQG